MTVIDIAADVLHRNFGMLSMTLKDFSDADLLVRPVPGANHAAWQLGHLIVNETNAANALKPGSAPPLPEGFAEKFKKETASREDADFFPKKPELMEHYQKAREAVISAVKSISPNDLDKPSPERMQKFAPTLGHVLFLFPQHLAMHVGQFQVIRRKLGKPVLF